MKTFKLIDGNINYPVGKYIMDNMPAIESMGSNLTKFIGSKFKKCNKVVLVCRGSSGAIIAALVSKIITKSIEHVVIAHIKKDGEDSHGGDVDIRYLKSEHSIFVIIDDFISTGETVKSIMDRIYPINIDILCITGTYTPDNLNYCVYPDRIKYCITSV